MCGIVGILSKHGTLSYYADNLFTNMLQMDSIRGPDSTGVFGVTKSGHVDSLKGNADGYRFTQSKQYGDFKSRIKDYSIVIGHNRKATVGKVTAENAHPFREKHIIMVHNGTLRGTQGLKDTEVDSQAICIALAEHDPVQALEKINGAYALVWYDSSDKTLNLARNSERPLILIEYPSMFVVSSEAGLPLWLNSRENRKPEPDGIKMVPEKKILTFKLDDIFKGPFEIPYEEYKAWTAPVHKSTGGYPNYGSHSSWPHHEKKEHQQTPLLLQNKEDKIIPITAKKESKHSSLLKAGECIVFELEDSQPENGAEVLLGHPIFGNEKDTNLIVRTVVPKGEDVFRYFGMGKDPFQNKLWSGTIQHIRSMAGMLTIFVTKMVPHTTVIDANGNANDEREARQAMALGCSRCKLPVGLDDAKESIIRKKSDGTWRVVCKTCINQSIAEAKAQTPGLNIRAATN